MKVVIVGAGITGCVAALQMAKNSEDVSLYDSSDQIGGVLRDVVLAGETFLNGCQYFDPGKSGFLRNITKAVSCDLTEFKHTYGSYTELFEDSIVDKDFAQPVFVHEITNQNFSDSNNSSLKARVQGYPKIIAEEIERFGVRFGGCLADLHYSCAEGMQISRIYFKNNAPQIAKIKSSSKIANEILGLPRSTLNQDAKISKSCIPLGGFNPFFNKLDILLRNKGVDINLSKPITPRRNGDGIDFYQKNKKILADLVIWCGNPTPVIHAAGLGRLDSPVSKMKLVCGHVHGNTLGELPTYIQVFSKKTSIVRIYLYEMNKRTTASVECFDENESTGSIIKNVNRILLDFGHTGKFHSVGTLNQKRYTLISNRDMNKIERFKKKFEHKGLISGGWHLYGRQAKINNIEMKVNNFYHKQLDTIE